MSLTIECQCGHVRHIEREAVTDGSWRDQPCPNCATNDDASAEDADEDRPMLRPSTANAGVHS
jgi:hypothetical protein